MALSLCIVFSNQVLAAATEPEAQTEATEGITDDEAQQIALDAAGYNIQNVRYTNIWKETVNGTEIIKLEFYLGPVCFGYHIDATTVEILNHQVID